MMLLVMRRQGPGLVYPQVWNKRRGGGGGGEEEDKEQSHVMKAHHQQDAISPSAGLTSCLAY